MYIATTVMPSGWFPACICCVDSMPVTMELKVKFMEVDTMDCTVDASVGVTISLRDIAQLGLLSATFSDSESEMQHDSGSSSQLSKSTEDGEESIISI